jgi:multidrug efflux pump subunit AcrA (membrane-fusion protein)
MRAEIDLANAKRTLRPGMTAEVTLDLRAIENALTIPVSAVRSQGDRYGVFVLDGDTAKQQEVETGLESAEWIQIIEGLSPEDQVIIATANPLTNGMRVTASAAGSMEQ